MGCFRGHKIDRNPSEETSEKTDDAEPIVNPENKP